VKGGTRGEEIKANREVPGRHKRGGTRQPIRTGKQEKKTGGLNKKKGEWGAEERRMKSTGQSQISPTGGGERGKNKKSRKTLKELFEALRFVLGRLQRVGGAGGKNVKRVGGGHRCTWDRKKLFDLVLGELRVNLSTRRKRKAGGVKNSSPP